jgi:Protein of unknown function (DUF3738)
MRNRWTTAGVVAIAVPLVLGLLTEPRLLAQSPAGQAATVPADRPAFDVASVKTNKSGGGFINLGNLGQSRSLYRATNVTLNILITAAYQLKPQQISGLPDWASSEHFDIDARAADNPGIDRKRLMLQSLLADRFLCHRIKISFATRYHWRPARFGEPARPPVPIACNTKERRTDHNTNECRVNQHGDRQRKSDHLDH